MQYYQIKNTGHTTTDCQQIALFLERMQSNLNPKQITGLHFSVKNGYIVDAFYTSASSPKDASTYYNKIK